MADVNAGTLHVSIAGDTSELEKSLQNAENDLKGFDKNVGKSVQSLFEMKKEFKALSRESLVGKTPAEIEATTKRMAYLKDAIGDTNSTIKSLSLDPFQKLAETVQVGATVMGGLAGATSLLGGDQEKLNELMQKTVALIAISNAAQEASVFFQERSAGIWLKNKTLEIAARLKEILTIGATTTAATAENAVKTKGSIITQAITKAQWLWNAAVAANPIGLIIAGVAALGIGLGVLAVKLSKNTEKYDDARKSVSSLNDEIEKNNSYNKLQNEIESTLGISLTERNKTRRKQIEEEIGLKNKLIEKNLLLSEETGFFGGETKNAKAANESLKELYNNLVELGDEKIILSAQDAAENTRQKLLSKQLSANLLSDNNIVNVGRSKAIELLKIKRDEDLKKEGENSELSKLIWANYYNDLAVLERGYRDKANPPATTIARKGNDITDISRIRGREEEINELARLNAKGLLTEAEYWAGLKKINDKYKDAKPEPLNIKFPVKATIDENNSSVDFNWLTDQVIDVSGSLESAVKNGLTDLASGIAESIGNIAAGTGGMDDLFQNMMSVIGDFLSSLGKSLIAAGIGAIAFKKLLATPGVAIAAGAALVALGAIVKAKLASGPSGSGSSYSSASTTTSSYDATGTRQLRGDGTLEVVVSGVLTGRGSDLQAVLDKEANRRSL